MYACDHMSLHLHDSVAVRSGPFLAAMLLVMLLLPLCRGITVAGMMTCQGTQWENCLDVILASSLVVVVLQVRLL